MEQVYAVPAHLLPAPRAEVLPWDEALYRLLATAGRFGPRDRLETDEAWRQVTVYAVLRHAGRTLLMRRLRGGADPRLHDRLSVGVGGHLNPVDASGGRDPIRASLEREMREEVEASLTAVRPLGFIHRDDDPVSRVHTGVLYLVESASEPRVRETDKLEGWLAGPDELIAVRERLEGWSAAALDALAGLEAPGSTSGGFAPEGRLR